MIKKLIELYNKPYNIVEDDELGLYVLNLLLTCLFFSIFFLLFLLFVGIEFFNASLTFIGMIICVSYVSIFCYKRNFIASKFGLYYKNGGFSYKYIALSLIGIYIALSFATFSIALMKSDIYSAFGYGISMLFPILFTYLNLDMFDDSSREIIVENEFGVKENIPVLGYFPGLFIHLGFVMGAGPLGLAITRLIKSILFNEYSFIFNLSLICILLIIEYYMYAPEIMNKILPFEARMGKGLMIYGLFFIFIIAVILFLMLFVYII